MAVDRLIPYARNARTHTDAQVAQIAASIREFGWTNPVLIDEADGLIAGHGRLLAARKLSMPEVPAIRLAGLTASQKRALVLADNKLALNAGWDDEVLRLELDALREDGFDIDLTGFADFEIDALTNVGNAGLTDPDDAPEPPVEPVSRAGDLWVLGRHRLLCGDCTVATDVERVLGPHQPGLCLTDPPYGIGEAYETHTDSKEALDSLIASFLPIARAMCKVVLLTPGVANVHAYPKPDWILCWTTPAGAGSGPWGFCCWQPVLAYGGDPFLRGGKGRRPDTLVKTETSEKLGHPCPKPVETWTWFMDRMDPSQTGFFYEPFSGSGTTLISAEKSGRRVVAIEKAPAYIDVAVRRWQAFAGAKATLDGDGRTFDEIEAERK